MMNYNLAKRLKEAGFPQTSNNKVCDGSDLDESGKAIWCCKPTLSELIEACGDSFDSLHRSRKIEGYGYPKEGDWVVRGYAKSDTTFEDLLTVKPPYIGGCSSPEEAVSELWIQLYGTPSLPENRS